MSMDHSVTPKATVSLRDIGTGMNLKESFGKGLVCTWKVKRDDLKASVAVSDRTVLPVKVDELKQMKDVNLTADYKLKQKLASGGITANGKYELGTKKYTAGATWDGQIAKKNAEIKGWYTNKDNLVAGEATVSINSTNKVNTTFNQKQPLTAKYTFVKDSLTLEPSYNFAKKGIMVAATKKVAKSDTVKVTYDVKSEGAAVEYNHKKSGVKATLSTKCGKSGWKPAKPTLTCVWEKCYEL